MEGDLIFSEKDYEDVVKYCDNALNHLGKYCMSAGSRLFVIYMAFRFIRDFAKSSK